MDRHEIEAEAVAQQLGAGGVDNLVANAERVCGYEQQHIALTNEGTITSLATEYDSLLGEERRIETVLLNAPPTGDLRRLRRRRIYCWVLTAVLTFSALAITILTFAPFRLGWISWVFAVGIAAVTPFLLEKLLERSEVLARVLTAVAAAAAVASLMLLAEVRGNLLEQQARQSQDQAVVLDDSQPSPETENTFYDKSSRALHYAMLLLAFSMEVGAGLALREAWRSMPDTSEDWQALRKELNQIRARKAEMVTVVVVLRNQPGIFAARFWRDFYRAMLSNAVRGAISKLLLLIVALCFFVAPGAGAQNRRDTVVAVDLTQSVATAGPDGKSEFQKNVDGVSRLLSQVPAGSRVTVIAITDRSFAQPYILLSARTASDPGYFGERLNTARSQLVRAWKLRSAHLEPHFQQTDIFGALHLASQIFAQQSDSDKSTLIIFSDMRQSTPELDLESPRIAPSFSQVITQCGSMPDFKNVRVFVLGTDGAAKSSAYWESLQLFWKGYFSSAGAVLQSYSVLRELPTTAAVR
jgi:hypothetical protein